MQTRKLTEVPRSEFAKEANFIVEIDEEMKRVPSYEVRRLIEDEESRAETAEQMLSNRLVSEAARAQAAEEALEGKLSEETARAEAAEKTNAEKLQAEAARAGEAERKVADDLAIERARALEAESMLASGLTSEAARAAEAETGIADRLDIEITRAEAAERANADALAAETIRAAGRENEIESNMADEISRAQETENAIQEELREEIARAGAAEQELSSRVSAEVSRATAAEDAIRGTIDTNKPNWDDKYTRNEVDNKFSALETAIDWKEAVDTFEDLAVVYPKPEDGWTVNTKDTDYTYRWSGTAWVAISANAIPKATQSVDGLLSKEDKAAYDEAYGKRHEHGNTSILDKMTQSLMDGWNAAYAHISDTVKHLTSMERMNWNTAYTHAGEKDNPHEVTAEQAGAAPASHTHTKAQITDLPTKVSQLMNDAGFITLLDVDTSQNHAHTNKGVLDQITQLILDHITAAYSHISTKNNPHGVTAAQAGAAPAGHTHSYLPLTGGTITGDLKFLRGTRTDIPIKLYEGDASGSALVSQAGGLYIAGSGESADKLYTALALSAGTERTFISSDQDISLVTNCQTIANRKTVVIDADGKITAPGGFAGTVKNIHRTLTLTAAGWSASYPYTQTISVAGVVASDDIRIIGVYVPANATQAQVKAWMKAAGYLMYNPSGVAAGRVTFKAYKKPEVDFQIITEGG